MIHDILATNVETAAGGCRWGRYTLYGLILLSNFPFSSPLAKGVGTPEVLFTCVSDEPPTTGWDEHPPVYASSVRIDSGESLLYVYSHHDYHVVHFTEVADYYLWPEGIVCHLLDPAYDYVVEIYLLGLVFSLWLELRGVAALHASAVVIDDRVAAFLATNKGGKSSLAASLMQAGYPLLTDDILPVDRRGELYVGRPGYPQMRMWPDQARHFLGHYEHLEIVHPAYSKRRVPVGEGSLGTFRNESAPLACFYLPERRNPTEWGTRIEITPISRGDALMALIRESFAAHIMEALGLQPCRLGLLAPLISQVPVRRIVYPEGFDRLPHVRRAILDDLASIE